jgi:predicted DNA binding protein
MILVQNDRRLTIPELGKEVGISYGTCQAILNEAL